MAQMRETLHRIALAFKEACSQCQIVALATENIEVEAEHDFLPVGTKGNKKNSHHISHSRLIRWPCCGSGDPLSSAASHLRILNLKACRGLNFCRG